MGDGPFDRDAVQSFVEDGYAVLRNALTADEVAEINAQLVGFARGEYPSTTAPQLPPDASDADALASVLAVHFPHWVNETILRYVTHPIVAGGAGQLAGAHLPWWDGATKCMQSMLFVKPPGLPGQAWHQDEHHIPTRDRSLLGAWIALDPATRENGCLWVLPGSHRTGYLYPVRPHGLPDEFDPAEESYGFEMDHPDSTAVPVELEAGDVVFLQGHLLHRSLRNRSSGYRRALVNHYMNAWSELPWDLSRAEAVRDWRVVVPTSGTDPYGWKGYEDPPRTVWFRPSE